MIKRGKPIRNRLGGAGRGGKKARLFRRETALAKKGKGGSKNYLEKAKVQNH